MSERAMKRPFGVFEMRKSRNRGGSASAHIVSAVTNSELTPHNATVQWGYQPLTSLSSCPLLSPLSCSSSFSVFSLILMARFGNAGRRCRRQTGPASRHRDRQATPAANKKSTEVQLVRGDVILASVSVAAAAASNWQ